MNAFSSFSVLCDLLLALYLITVEGCGGLSVARCSPTPPGGGTMVAECWGTDGC